MNKTMLCATLLFSSLLSLTGCNKDDLHYQIKFELFMSTPLTFGWCTHVFDATLMDGFNNDNDFFYYLVDREPAKESDDMYVTGFELAIDRAVFHVNDYYNALFNRKYGYNEEGEKDSAVIVVSKEQQNKLINMWVRYACSPIFKNYGGSEQ